MLAIGLLLLSVLFTSISLYYIVDVIHISRSRHVTTRWLMLLSINIIFFIAILIKAFQAMIMKQTISDLIVIITYFSFSVFSLIVAGTTYKTFEILYKEMDEKKEIQKRITELNRRLTIIIKKNKMKKRVK